MKLSLSIAVTLLLASSGAHGAPVELTIDTTPLQTIRGWGAAIAPMEWDGHYELPSKQRWVQLIRELSPTIIRLIVGSEMRCDKQTGRITPLSADSNLVQKMLVIHDLGIRRYIISLASAPYVMRSWHTEKGCPMFVPTGLRSDMEHQFVNYVISLLEYIKIHDYPLPEAIAFSGTYLDPALPYLGGECLYTKEQWQRLDKLIHAALRASNLSQIEVIAPDATDRELFNSALEQAATRRSNKSKPIDGIGVNVGTGRVCDTAEDTEYEPLPNDINVSIWAFDRFLGYSPTERDTLLLAFKRLGTDLIRYGTNYWFANYCLGLEDNANALAWGKNCNKTELYYALRDFWRFSDNGAVIHRMNVVRGRNTSRSSTTVDAFCVIAGKRVLISITNDSDLASTYFIDDATIVRLNTYGIDESPLTRIPGNRDNTPIIDVPPRTLVLVFGSQ